MRAADIRASALAAIATVAPDADVANFAGGEPIRAQAGLDSLDWLNLAVVLHDRLGVKIPESDYDQVATLDALVAYLARKRPRRTRRAPRKKTLAPTRAAAKAAATKPRRIEHRVNGRRVTVRPIRPQDAPMEADFVQHLSEETRYLRFMASLRELPKAKLRYLTAVDQIGHVALVATVKRGGRTVEVGVARYIVDPSGKSCEFAIAVDDEWQGTGLGGVLMHDLIAVARSRGLARMEGIVLAANSRMLRFTRQLGFRAERDPDDYSTLRVVLPLR